jgi:hypothetical protein
MCESEPINQQQELKDDQDFGRTFSNPSSNWDLCLSGRANIDSSQEPICLFRSDRSVDIMVATRGIYLHV